MGKNSYLAKAREKDDEGRDFEKAWRLEKDLFRIGYLSNINDGLIRQALEYKVEAADLYLKADAFRKAAFCLSRAGQYASYLKDYREAAEFKMMAGMVFYHINDFINVAYSLSYASLNYSEIGEIELKQKTAELSVTFYRRVPRYVKKGFVVDYIEGLLNCSLDSSNSSSN